MEAQGYWKIDYKMRRPRNPRNIVVTTMTLNSREFRGNLEEPVRRLLRINPPAAASIFYILMKVNPFFESMCKHLTGRKMKENRWKPFA